MIHSCSGGDRTFTKYVIVKHSFASMCRCRSKAVVTGSNNRKAFIPWRWLVAARLGLLEHPMLADTLEDRTHSTIL